MYGANAASRRTVRPVNLVALIELYHSLLVVFGYSYMALPCGHSGHEFGIFVSCISANAHGFLNGLYYYGRHI